MKYIILYLVTGLMFLTMEGVSQNIIERRIVEIKTSTENFSNQVITDKEPDWSTEITGAKMIEDIPMIKTWETLSSRISLIDNSLLSKTISQEQINEFTNYKTQLLQAELNLLISILNQKESLLPIEQLTNEKKKVENELRKSGNK